MIAIPVFAETTLKGARNMIESGKNFKKKTPFNFSNNFLKTARQNKLRFQLKNGKQINFIV